MLYFTSAFIDQVWKNLPLWVFNIPGLPANNETYNGLTLIQTAF
jgi:hypothetical protein